MFIKRALVPLTLLLAVSGALATNNNTPKAPKSPKASKVPKAPKSGNTAFTKSNQCKNAAKTFVNCAESTEFVSADGTWTNKGCASTFKTATADCVAAISEYVSGGLVPAYVTAGTLGKTGFVEGYIGVPEDNNGGKATALNCKACSAVYKKVASCVVGVAEGTLGANLAIQLKAVECIAGLSKLDQALATVCAPLDYNHDVVGGKVTWIHAVPQLDIDAGTTGSLVEDCPAVQAYLKSNGAATAKVLKGSGYFEEQLQQIP